MVPEKIRKEEKPAMRPKTLVKDLRERFSGNVLTFQEQCFLSDQSHSKPLLWSLEKARSALGTFVRWLNVENGGIDPSTDRHRFDSVRS